MCFFLMTACFDTLSRSLLNDKLQRYGIRGVSLDSVKACFATRSQHVCYDAVKTSNKCQEIGVNQGSKTSPIFSVMHSSDFHVCALMMKVYFIRTILYWCV